LASANLIRIIFVLLVPFSLLSLNFVRIESTLPKPDIRKLISGSVPSDENFLPAKQTADAATLVYDLVIRTKEIKALALTNIFKERINGEYLTKKASFKINLLPFKLYMKEEYPRNGLEVLYVEGTNSGKAWVRPNSFPWATLHLNPTGSTMRNGQHHSIYKSGYGFFIGVLEHLQTKYSNELNKMLADNGIVKYNNKLCRKITFTNPYFKYVNYKTGENETLETLSWKLFVNDYMIYEINNGAVDFEALKSGNIIRVPNDYGASMVLYIDEKTRLLAGVKVFDDKGLWEEYTYMDVVLNPPFTSTDFNSGNPHYNF
jgi:hypothetical protein